MTECYIGLGGNYPHTFSCMLTALERLSTSRGVSVLKTSRLYRTTPVSPFPQAHYLNAVCRFSCTLSLHELFALLQTIEKECGKSEKSKDKPRVLDLDLLFFGDTIYYSSSLVVPHPKWHERLFVLAPLADVTDTIPLDINIHEMLKKFSNPHNEEVLICGTLI